MRALPTATAAIPCTTVTRDSWWIRTRPDGNDWLLVDATPSDTCLNCHSSANSSRGVLDGDCNTGHSREKGGGNYIFLSCPDLQGVHSRLGHPG